MAHLHTGQEGEESRGREGGVTDVTSKVGGNLTEVVCFFQIQMASNNIQQKGWLHFLWRGVGVPAFVQFSQRNTALSPVTPTPSFLPCRCRIPRTLLFPQIIQTCKFHYWGLYFPPLSLVKLHGTCLKIHKIWEGVCCFLFFFNWCWEGLFELSSLYCANSLTSHTHTHTHWESELLLTYSQRLHHPGCLRLMRRRLIGQSDPDWNCGCHQNCLLPLGLCMCWWKRDKENVSESSRNILWGLIFQ